MSKSNSNSSPSDSGALQSSKGLPPEIRKLQSQLDELREMTDLVPVLAGVQEHLEEEKKKHHQRMKGMAGVVGVLLILFLVAPFVLGRALLKQSEAQLEAQREFQTVLVEKLEGALEETNAGSLNRQAQVIEAYEQELEQEKARMRSVLESLIIEVDAAIQAQSDGS